MKLFEISKKAGVGKKPTEEFIDDIKFWAHTNNMVASYSSPGYVDVHQGIGTRFAVSRFNDIKAQYPDLILRDVEVDHVVVNLQPDHAMPQKIEAETLFVTPMSHITNINEVNVPAIIQLSRGIMVELRFAEDQRHQFIQIMDWLSKCNIVATSISLAFQLITDEPVPILSVFHLPFHCGVWMNNRQSLADIVNKHLQLGDIYSCQQELIDAGYEEWANF